MLIRYAIAKYTHFAEELAGAAEGNTFTNTTKKKKTKHQVTKRQGLSNRLKNSWLRKAFPHEEHIPLSLRTPWVPFSSWEENLSLALNSEFAMRSQLVFSTCKAGVPQRTFNESRGCNSDFNSIEGPSVGAAGAVQQWHWWVGSRRQAGASLGMYLPVALGFTPGKGCMHGLFTRLLTSHPGGILMVGELQAFQSLWYLVWEMRMIWTYLLCRLIEI